MYHWQLKSFATCALAVVCWGNGPIAEISVDIGTAKTVGVYKTTATLQVVGNPLLERTFKLPNGTVIPNPIHDTIWNSLKELHADHVRFQAWFPYPHRAVAELDKPVDGKPTSWNFTSMLPQMEDFMANTAAHGHPVIWNMGTIPCWMFWGPTTDHSNCPYPADPDMADFGYGARGIRPFFFKDPSGHQLADYFARMMSYLVNGHMVDEHGVLHEGGPAYNLSAKSGHIFEFLNEGEHYYSPSEYVNDYDATVPAIQAALGQRSPSFMGVGGCQDGHWGWWFLPKCSDWLPVYLDRSRHKVENISLDYASIHYYATTRNRSDVDSYTQDLFGSADKWFPYMDKHIATRDRLSPNTKLALTELGVLMGDDAYESFGEDGGLPDIFFNAAAAFLAYVFTGVAKKGVDIACFSQFVGSPAIEKWGIPSMQFPSGSMIDWNTGLGNAKYWVLKLLIDHLKKGDLIQDPKVWMPVTEHVKAKKVSCEALGPWTFDNEAKLECKDPHARIDRIWADMGFPPDGQCGSYAPNRNCSNSKFATAWALERCWGRHSCTLFDPSLTATGWTLPESVAASLAICPGAKNDTLLGHRFSVQFQCTGDEGSFTSAEYTGDSIFSTAFLSADGKVKKLLLVNKLSRVVNITVSGKDIGQGVATAHIVDGLSVSRSSAEGIRQERWTPTAETDYTTVELQPFAVVMAVMDQGKSSSTARPLMPLLV